MLATFILEKKTTRSTAVNFETIIENQVQIKKKKNAAL